MFVFSLCLCWLVCGVCVLVLVDVVVLVCFVCLCVLVGVCVLVLFV